MATLSPFIGSCAGRMNRGERRLAERLEQKLDDDYLIWYDVPVGPRWLTRTSSSCIPTVAC